MALVEINDSNFEAEVLKSDVPVVVDYYAPWCGPCRVVAPALASIAQELGDKVKIVKFNIDENPEVPTEQGIRSVPTLIVYKDGESVATKTGAGTKSVLQAWIEDNT